MKVRGHQQHVAAGGTGQFSPEACGMLYAVSVKVTGFSGKHLVDGVRRRKGEMVIFSPDYTVLVQIVGRNKDLHNVIKCIFSWYSHLRIAYSPHCSHQGLCAEMTISQYCITACGEHQFGSSIFVH